MAIGEIFREIEIVELTMNDESNQLSNINESDLSNS